MSYHKNHKSKAFSYLIGKKSVIDGLKNNLPIELVCLFKNDWEIKTLAAKKNIKVEMHSINWFNSQIDNKVHHQGVVAKVNTNNLLITLDQLIAKVANKPKSTILVLDEIINPGNFGAILRTALATNVDGVIFKNNNQTPINTFVIKNSLGAVFYLNLVMVANLRYALDKLEKVGFWTVAATLHQDSQDYRSVDLDKIALIVGNEDKGISPLIVREAQYKVKIPINPQIESLNVSVATAILLFQYTKNNF